MLSRSSVIPPLLAYDDRTRYGHRTNFHHYLWGYLLPALNWAIQNQPAEGRVKLEQCAPQLDDLAHNAFGILGLQVDLVPLRTTTYPQITLPRWDRIVRDYHNLLVPLHLATANQYPITVRTTKALLTLRSCIFPDELQQVREGVARVRESIIPKAKKKNSRPLPDNHLTILLRSPPPDLSKKSTRRYGTNLRKLEGVRSAADRLVSLGQEVSIFEPGSVSFSDQVAEFSAIHRLVAIRGAELANLVWMEPGSRGLVLSPVSMRRKRNPIAAIASFLGIDVTIVEIAEDFPTLDADLVLQQLPQ